MNKKNIIRLVIVLIVSALVLTLFVIKSKDKLKNIEKTTNAEPVMEDKLASSKNEDTNNEEVVDKNNEEEILNPEDIKLKFGDKARISEEEIRNLYTDDINMLLLSNKLIGHPAPNLKFKSVDKEELSIDDFKGEDIIVEFMGTWCPVCEDASQDVKQFKEMTDIKIIPIGLGDDAESIKNFMDKFDVNEIAHYYADTDDVLDTYEIAFVPIYFYIDKEGYIQMILAGNSGPDMLLEYAKKVFNLK